MTGVKGKVAVVTGGASGLGEATALRLAEAGAVVVVADIDAANGKAVAQSMGGRARFVTLDVSDESDWIRVLDDVLETEGGLDTLVNNAGVVVMATIEDTSAEQLDFVRRVNFDGPFFGCKHAIPRMAASGGGAIINISSAASLVGTPAYAAYSATKGALRSLTQTVAVHCKQRGNQVRCNSIHPGGIDTPMVQNLATTGGSELAMAMNAMGKTSDRIGQPDDIAAAVVYLAGDEAGFVNGACLSVDDGMAAGGFSLAE